MKKYFLDGKWKMSGLGNVYEGDIPGSVYSFLHVDNNELPDPYFRDNEKLYTDITENDFTFEREFNFELSKNPFYLVFDGLDTLCEIYLNNEFIAKTDNMHVQYSFEVSKKLSNGVNSIKVICRSVNKFIKQQNEQNKLFGATDCMQGYSHVRKAHSMMGWDWGPRLPDAGIWKSVYLVKKDSAEILDVHVIQRHADGKVFLTPQVKVDGGEIEVFATSPCGKKIDLIANCETEIENPKLWWPNGLGEQNLYKITVNLKENGAIVDKKEQKVGLRELKLIRKPDEDGESFYHEVNGIAVFAMGADYIPEDAILSRTNKERTKTLLLHCKNSNFNAIRVWGGGYYPNDYFFELCDELGLIVFMDLMFACSVYEPDDKMKESIVQEIKQNLSRIRHHACLGVICGNNEIEWHFDEYVAISGRQDIEHLRSVYLELFENLLPKTVNEVASYLPYIPSSPTSGGKFVYPNGENHGDCHDWESNWLLVRNRHFRYVSEFGFQALPSIKTIGEFTKPCDRNIFSRVMDVHQRSFGGNELILSYLSRYFKYASDLETLVYASQVLQAESIKYRVEHFRRNRGRSMGTLYWQLNDVWPCTSWASIDYYGRFKGLQYYAKRFYSPVHLSCEEVGEMQTMGFVNAQKGTYSEEKSARLCVTNDTLNVVSGTVKWALCDAFGVVVESGQEDVTVEPMSAKWLNKSIFEGLNPASHHLRFWLEGCGEVISEGFVLFTAPKYHEFENPEITYKICGDEITVCSKAFAKAVSIEGVEGDLILSDNFFDMEKGERRVKILSGSSKTLKIKSAFDVK